MKLEVGMYARYEYENVIYIGKITFISETMGFEEKLMFSFDNCIEEIYKENIVNASYNIIDILEEGDYVNGDKVIKIFNPMFLSIGELPYIITINGKYDEQEIETIVTHEQMEQMEYKVGE